MNLLQGKSNQYLREAILEESLEKVKRYLTLKIGKADVGALTEVRSALCCFARVSAWMGLTSASLCLWVSRGRAAGSACCTAPRSRATRRS